MRHALADGPGCLIANRGVADKGALDEDEEPYYVPTSMDRPMAADAS